MADIWRDFWVRETGTGQQVAQLHDIYDDDDENYDMGPTALLPKEGVLRIFSP